MNNLIIVAGPTAVGKTFVSVQLAHHYGELPIISADSRQIYQQMQIGTAKPGKDEQKGIVHYMIDNKQINENFNAYQYEVEVLQILNNHLWPKSNKAIVTGGSGLYIDALCKGIDYMPDIPVEIREKWKMLYQSKGIEYLQKLLLAKDPVFFEEVDKANYKRMIRALEVIDVSGKPFSSFRHKQPKARNFNLIKIALELPRAELYQNIDTRMDQMIAQGLFTEAEQLFPHKDKQALQTVGYKEIFDYLENKYDREEAIRLLKRNSRRYAKRQLTWFKKDLQYQWFSPIEFSKIVDYIESKLK